MAAPELDALQISRSGYDATAWFYNRYCGPTYKLQALKVFDKLLFPRIPAHCRVFDLCCGTGHLAMALAGRGYRPTGLDNAPEMLRYARQNAAAVEFVLADARNFQLPAVYHAAVSTFDSLNHIMSLDDLVCVFRNVR